MSEQEQPVLLKTIEALSPSGEKLADIEYYADPGYTREWWRYKVPASWIGEESGDRNTYIICKTSEAEADVSFAQHAHRHTGEDCLFRECHSTWSCPKARNWEQVYQ